MDKNVGSVNLDELKAAREALDRERGIETDPNMYKDYDPEKHKAQKEQEMLERQNASSGDISDGENHSDDEEIIVPAEEEIVSDESNEIVSDTAKITTSSDSDDDDYDKALNNLADAFKEFEIEDSEEINSQNDEGLSTKTDSESQEQIVEEDEISEKEEPSIVENSNTANTSVESENINFDVYDNFADFEVNKESTAVENNATWQSSEPATIENTQNNSVDKENNNDESIDDFLSELDNILSQETDDNETKTEQSDQESEDSTDNTSDFGTQVDIKETEDNTIEEEPQKFEENQNIQDESVEKSDDNFAKFEVENSSTEDSEYDTEILTDFSKLGELVGDIEEESKVEEPEPIERETEELEDEKETEDSDEEPEDEIDEEFEEDSIKDSNKTTKKSKDNAGAYTDIEEFKFVDVMSTDDFKENERFSYVLGKDSEDNIVYGNLRDTCGTAIFSKNEDVVYEQFSSILLSLLLKNSPSDVQFVICDAMFDSEFDVFNNSSYMYFNRVAKNNREIVDSLVELSKEIETRYNNLVYAGVKSISAYNLSAEERGNPPMPYLVLFLNNYAKMTQFLDSDRINICLHNILKFGRIVGVYAIVASTAEIERNDINLNLPTRVCYKADSEEYSISAIGRKGAELLDDEKDFLYSTVFDEEIKHLKVANLSRKEIELIIENLEN